MEYSFDLSKVNFQTLKEGGYDENLIEALENENFEYLERGEIKQSLENREFVEPLLYACINSRKAEMLQVYVHLEDRVQTQLLTDYNLSCNVLLNVPKVIENTPLAKDERAILANVNDKPEIVRYISNDLMDNPTFVSELAEKNPEVVKELIEKCPVDKLIAANPNLVNNYEFFRQAAENNKEVIEYAIENSDKLGLEAINAVRDVAKEDAEKANKDFIDEHVKNNENSGFKALKEYLDEHSEEDNPAKARLITAKKLSELETIDPEIVRKELRDAILRLISFEKIQENPEHEITPTELKGLYSIEILQEEIEKAGLQDEPEIKEMFERCKEKYIGFADRMIQQREAQGKCVLKSFKERVEGLKQQEHIEEKTQEHNAERSVALIAILPNRDGIEEVILHVQTPPEGIELTPEQLQQLEADLAARNVERENVQEVESPKRGIAALREGPEQDGQDR